MTQYYNILFNVSADVNVFAKTDISKTGSRKKQTNKNTCGSERLSEARLFGAGPQYTAGPQVQNRAAVTGWVRRYLVGPSSLWGRVFGGVGYAIGPGTRWGRVLDGAR